jgi:hypothetical protein
VTINVVSLADFDLKVTVYSGKVTRNELVEYYGTSYPIAVAAAGRWISYFAPNADLGEIDVAALAEMTRLRRIVLAKLKELRGDQVVPWAIVCSSSINRPIVDLWLSYFQGELERPYRPVVFTSLEAAADWLGLSAAARGALARAVGLENLASADDHRA